MSAIILDNKECIGGKIMFHEKFKIVNIFFQVDTLEGFQYWDVSGEMLNQYLSENNQTQFRRGLDELSLINPAHNIKEVKHAVNKLWIHFNIESINEIENAIEGNLDKMKNLQQVSKVSRVALRMQLAYEPKRKKDVKKIFSKYQMFKGTKTTKVVFNQTHNDLMSSMIIEEATNNNTKQSAILIDVDCGYNKLDTIENVKIRLSIILRYINEQFISILDELIRLEK